VLRKACYQILLTLLLALMLAHPVMAQSLEQAAREAASRHNAKVLSARTIQQGNKRVHVIKLLTRDGVVKTVRITVREQRQKQKQKRDRR
jgi:hypothetical protein